jgi:hypothetical protein
MPDQAQQFQYITNRQVLGMFFEALEQYLGQIWIDKLSNTFESNQITETYAGIGNPPQMREWVGSKQRKGFLEFSTTITNRDWESTIEFKNKDLRRDKTGQVEAKIGEFAQRALSHDALVISALINGGTSSTVAITGAASATIKCYDGQPLFSTSHTIGTTALSNSITLSLGTLATALGTSVGVGTTTNPTPAAFSAAIQAAVTQLYGFTDDQAQPINEFAREFVVMVPVAFAGAAAAAVKGQYLALGYTNPLLDNLAPSLQDMKFTVVPNPRLTWTNQFAVFRTDCPFKAILRQYEDLTASASPEMQFGKRDGAAAGTGLIMKVLAEGSDWEFNNNSRLYSLEKSAFAGYGRFDTCVLQQFVS